ncbi:MAG: 5-(carboxyamino)imidazole ribonucleotide mutase [Calditrichaeota bacterium]|nr:5-(carboxyamino)imidazole ribonucleotide mutase [Calditrichota bacterium]
MGNGYLVSIIVGSSSDEEMAAHTKKYLDYFNIPYDFQVLSAHRNAAALSEYLKKAVAQGVQVFIAQAGMAAHLPGAIAAQTSRPVIGVPLPNSALNGLDALLSEVQMPSGIPVATMAIGKAGAINAAVLAAEILALSRTDLQDKLVEFRNKGSKL